MKRKIMLLDELCTKDDTGLLHFNVLFNKSSSVRLDTYWFESSNLDETDYQREIDIAVNKVINEQFDAVLLNLIEDDKKMSLKYALPKLYNNGIPVIVFSDSFQNQEIFANVATEILRKGKIILINSTQLSFLHEYVESLFHAKENFAKFNYGFEYRHEDKIESREIIQGYFNKNAKDIGSKRIEIPLIAPVKNFLADNDSPRPLRAKDSNKLFAGVANDGIALSVRYEGTALVAKWVANELREKNGETFLFHYFQEMVRVEFTQELDENHYRSFFQAGLELFTIDYKQHLENIDKTIQMINNFTNDLDPSYGVKIRISHVYILNKLFEKYLPENIYKLRGEKYKDLDAAQKKRLCSNNRYVKNKLVEAMEKGLMDDLNNILENLEVVEIKGILRILKEAQLKEMSVSEGIKILRESNEYTEDDIRDLLEIEQKSSKWKNCYFDPGIHRSLGFYSGITMQGDLIGPDGKIYKEVLGGGEFTGMVESFSYYEKPVYSFGLAYGVERLMNLFTHGKKKDK